MTTRGVLFPLFFLVFGHDCTESVCLPTLRCVLAPAPAPACACALLLFLVVMCCVLCLVGPGHYVERVPILPKHKVASGELLCGVGGEIRGYAGMRSQKTKKFVGSGPGLERQPALTNK